MSVSSPLLNESITKKQLSFHLSSKNKRSQEIANPNQFTAIAGESIKYGNYIYMSSDGKVYQSSANLKPAHFIALSDAENDEVVLYQFFGYVNMDNEMEIGKTIFLTIVNANINFSQSIPESTSGKIIQRLGYPISDKLIYLKIEPPRLIQ